MEPKSIHAKCRLSGLKQVTIALYRAIYQIEATDIITGGTVTIYLDNDEAATEFNIEVIGGAMYSLYHMDGSPVHALGCSVNIRILVDED